MSVDDGKADIQWTADAKEARDMVHLWVKALDGEVRIAMTADQADEMAERLKQGGRMSQTEERALLARMVEHLADLENPTPGCGCPACANHGVITGLLNQAREILEGVR